MNNTSTIEKTPALNPGDKLGYSTQFLESIGECHGVMADGRGVVLEREAVNEDFVLIFADWQEPFAAPEGT